MAETDNKETNNTPVEDTAQQEQESTFRKLKESVKEDDPRPTSQLSLRAILGGDILNASFFRSQLGLIVLVVAFTIAYVALRYQCQQDMIVIDKLEKELIDAKYRALSSTSVLTERCRESHILELIKANSDSLIQISDQLPYIINVPKGE